MCKASKKQPNIVFILTDDQGYWTLGCYGNREIRTPNIDALAASGLRCENFFCASPVCSPARASLLTGRIPSQHGVLDWIRAGDGVKTPPIEYLADMPAYTDLLAEAGYRCGLSGKWHLGDSMKPQKSFSHWYAFIGGSGPYHDAQVCRDGQLTREPGYLTETIAEDAMAFMDDAVRDGIPFVSQVHFTAPHSPMVDQHPKAYVDDYASRCTFVDSPQDPRHPWMQKHAIDIQYSESLASKDRKEVTMGDLLAGYYASIQAVDDQVGRIIAHLKRLGVLENTLVIFTSDNGFSCGKHGIWGKGNATYPNNMYDTSVKVPAIFSMPGRVSAGAETSAMLSAYDVMPTLLALCGVENPNADELPGRSFLNLLETGDETGLDAVVVFDEYGPVRMVRTREWKYIHRYPYGPHELYDLTHDPDEYWNLMDEGRRLTLSPAEIEEKVLEMRTLLETWFRRYTNPTLDGRHEPVTGRGQLRKLGPEADGQETFSPWISQEYSR